MMLALSQFVSTLSHTWLFITAFGPGSGDAVICSDGKAVRDGRDPMVNGRWKLSEIQGLSPCLPFSMRLNLVRSRAWAN